MIFQNKNISDVKKETGLLVKKMRLSNNLSQEELSNKLNLSRITIQNIENGKNFTIDTMLLIFQFFDEMDSFYDFIKSKSEDYNKTESFY